MNNVTTDNQKKSYELETCNGCQFARKLEIDCVEYM